MNMKKSLILVFLFLLPFTTVEASEQKSLELPRVQVIPIQDTQSDRQYELYIKLPEGYSENNDVKYPVVYFTDAMWHVEMLSGSTEYLMNNVILVGISWQKDLKDARAHDSRFRDYTLTPSQNTDRQRGEASNHLAFIRNDVFTYVENTYRTDPDQRTYFGYSLGGLFGAYILVAQPNTFKNYIFGSPALGGGGGRYISELEANLALKRKDLNANVFIAVGALEKTFIGPIEDFISKLKSRNYASLSIQPLAVIEGANHGTAFPVMVVRSIKWLSDLERE